MHQIAVCKHNVSAGFSTLKSDGFFVWVQLPDGQALEARQVVEAAVEVAIGRDAHDGRNDQVRGMPVRAEAEARQTSPVASDDGAGVMPPNAFACRVAAQVGQCNVALSCEVTGGALCDSLGDAPIHRAAP
jgi:hypothetical protein